MENKAGFVKAINDALIAYGDGRYDYLEDSPLHYVEEEGSEYVYRGDKFVACVTMDSLRAVLTDIGKNAGVI